MLDGVQDNDSAIRCLFLERYFRDRQTGIDRSMLYYQTLFPGNEDLIADLYVRIKDSEKVDSSFDLTAQSQNARAVSSLSEFRHRQIGRYRLLRTLGRGGQGVVYLAEDRLHRRTVALKLLTSVDINIDSVRRFRREARIASGFKHNGICRVYGLHMHYGIPLISMDYVEGVSLGEVIKHNRDREKECPATELHLAQGTVSGARIAERIARALHAIHTRGVIHRDVKPSNIMLRRSGDPVLVDFGLARLRGCEGDDITQSGDIIGSPPYMSPEQVRGDHVLVDRRTDVYSLGATLYELVTLRRPFTGPSREALQRQILQSPTPDPRQANSSVDRSLSAIIQMAMSKDMRRRYNSANDLADDLQRYQAGFRVVARPPGRCDRIRAWIKARPTTAAAAAALLIGLALGAGITLTLTDVEDARPSSASLLITAPTLRVPLSSIHLPELHSLITTRHRASDATWLGQATRVARVHAPGSLRDLCRHPVIRSLLLEFELQTAPTATKEEVALLLSYDADARVPPSKRATALRLLSRTVGQPSLDYLLRAAELTDKEIPFVAAVSSITSLDTQGIDTSRAEALLDRAIANDWTDGVRESIRVLEGVAHPEVATACEKLLRGKIGVHDTSTYQQAARTLHAVSGVGRLASIVLARTDPVGTAAAACTLATKGESRRWRGALHELAGHPNSKVRRLVAGHLLSHATEFDVSVLESMRRDRDAVVRALAGKAIELHITRTVDGPPATTLSTDRTGIAFGVVVSWDAEPPLNVEMYIDGVLFHSETLPTVPNVISFRVPNDQFAQEWEVILTSSNGQQVREIGFVE